MLEERFPKELVVAGFSRSSRLAHIVLKLKDVTGTMAEVSSILAAEKVSIRQGSTFTVGDGEYGVYDAFVALPGEGYKLEDLVKKLEASSFVLGVQALEGVEGGVVDTLTFPIEFSGERVVLMGTNALVGVFDALESVFGTGGTVIIYQWGANYGRAFSADLAKTLTRPYMTRNFRYGLQLVMATGLGIPKVLDASGDLTRATVRVDGCFECAGRRKSSGYFMAGFLAGVFSFLSGRELTGTETVCVTRGADHCEFTVSPSASRRT